MITLSHHGSASVGLTTLIPEKARDCRIMVVESILDSPSSCLNNPEHPTRDYGSGPDLSCWESTAELRDGEYATYASQERYRLVLNKILPHGNENSSVKQYTRSIDQKLVFVTSPSDFRNCINFA